MISQCYTILMCTWSLVTKPEGLSTIMTITPMVMMRWWSNIIDTCLGGGCSAFINEVIKRGEGGLRDAYDEILTGLHLSALAAGWKRGTPQFIVK